MQLVKNLVKLAKQYTTTDEVQSMELRRAFRRESLANNIKVVVYLMEVVGSREGVIEHLQKENEALKSQVAGSSAHIQTLESETNEI